jgi:hypothetical protein
MVSINDVRETVLAICNKNNYGYISPDDFNLYAKQAQLEVFNEYMSKYNYYINLENNHTSGSDLADLAEAARESIEVFIDSDTLVFNAVFGSVSTFDAPSGWYHINTLVYNGNVEIAKGSRLDIIRLANSNLTAPTEQYPMYYMGNAGINMPNGTIAIIPNTIQSNVAATYVRYPVDPKWDYVTLINGEPMYNAAGSVDFEVAEDDEPTLVNKILEKAGLSIREPEVYKTASMNDNEQQ